MKPEHENLLKEINWLAHSAGVDSWIRDRLAKVHRMVRELAREAERANTCKLDQCQCLPPYDQPGHKAKCPNWRGANTCSQPSTVQPAINQPASTS